MDFRAFIKIFFLSLPIVILFFFYYFSIRKINKALRKLSNYLDGSISKFPFFTMPSFCGKYKGLRFSIVANPIANEGRLPYLKIIFFKDSPFKLVICQASFWNRIDNLVTKKQLIKIYNDIFRKDFSVFSDKPSDAISYLSRESIKISITELFSKGFNMLSIDGKKIWINKLAPEHEPYYNIAVDLEQSNILDILLKLSLLVTAVPNNASVEFAGE